MPQVENLIFSYSNAIVSKYRIHSLLFYSVQHVRFLFKIFSLTILLFVALSFIHINAVKSETDEERSNKNIHELFEYFLYHKKRYSVTGYDTFPLWDKSIRVYIDKKVDSSLLNTTISSITNLAHLTDLSLTWTESEKDANIVVISHKGDDQNIVDGGKWHELLGRKMLRKKATSLTAKTESMNCHSINDFFYGNMQFSMAAVVYDNNKIGADLFSSYGQRCMKISLMLSMGVLNFPTYSDSIVNSDLHTSCYTSSDNIMIRLSYTKEFRQFLTGEMAEHEFKRFLSEFYSEFMRKFVRKC